MNSESGTRYKHTCVGDIPIDWEVTTIGEIGEVITGKTPSTKQPEYWGGNILFVTPTDIGENVYQDTAKRTVSQKGVETGKKVPLGSVMVTCIASIGKIAIAKESVLTNQQINTIIPNPHVNNLYLYYSLRHGTGRLQIMAGKTSVPIVNKTTFQEFTIPLPPLPEQRKIAQILSTWDNAIEKTETLIQAKKKLKKGLMQQMLTGKKRFGEFVKSTKFKKTKIGMVPEDWDVNDLGNLGVFLKGKGILKKELSPSGLPCIRYGEIYTHHECVIKNFYSFITPQVARSSKQIQQNDILFAGSGETPDEIGKAVAHIRNETAYAGGDIVILRNHGLYSECLAYILNHDLVNKQKYRLGQGHSVVHIYSKDLKRIFIPIISTDEQRKIATVLSTIDKEISILQSQLFTIKQQKKGLMQQLLTGKRRVKP